MKSLDIERFAEPACPREDNAIFVVITGGPCVGKTTTISMLKSRGYKVVPEQATQVLKEGVFLPWENRDAFQKEVLRRQMDAEAPYLGSNEVVFLDRGLFDGEAYYLCDNLPIPPVFGCLPVNRYQLALIMEDLSFFENDGIRYENLEFTRKLTPVIENCYSKRDIDVARIPAAPPAERLEMVLNMVRPYVTSSAAFSRVGSLAFAT